MSAVEDISKNYFDFINKNTNISKLDNDNYETEIITPYVDTTGEAIAFTVRNEGDFYTITDDGFAIWELEQLGVDVSRKSKRKELLESILEFNSFNLNDSNEIIKTVTKNDIGQAIHDMTQLQINVSDLSYLSKGNVAQQFLQDVNNYFFNHEDYYNFFPEFNITGRSTYNHRFNFVFMSKGKSKLTRVHRFIDKQKVDSILTSWLDTIEYRNKYYRNKEELYVILSDEGYKNLNEKHSLALKSYDIRLLNFSDENSLVKNLGA